MAKLMVEGGRALYGTAEIHGAKNSVLPVLAASVLSCGRCVIARCPEITDVDAALQILTCLGGDWEKTGGTVVTDTARVSRAEIPAVLMETMRASIIFLGALLGRFRQCRLSLPGGCALGHRPIDYHLQALGALGVRVRQDGGQLLFDWPRPHGGVVQLPFPSVGATENVLLAAVTVDDETILRGAAREPEVVDLCDFLSAMGADLTGAGTDTLTIRGGKPLHGAVHCVVPDRIETATYLAAAAACGGDVLLRHTRHELLSPVLEVLEKAGCRITRGENTIRLERHDILQAVDGIQTGTYPAFPTDAQAPVLAALLRARGVSSLRETVFRERFQYLPQLRRFGAEVTVDGDAARVTGVKTLYGTSAAATDLRGGAGVLIAALQAEGESTVCNAELIGRGYAELIPGLRALGAEIREG